MVLEKECQKKMEEKLYPSKEEKKENIYQYKKFSLPKKMKLKIKNISFNKNIIYNFLLIKIKKNKFNYPRIGILIRKKYIKLSVKRNKLKRIIYETFRLKQYKIKNNDYLLIVKKKILYIKNFLFFKKIWKIFYKNNKI